jgi:hypothetical protein
MITRPFLTAIAAAHVIIAITIIAITPTQAAKMKELKDWCLGNGCLTGAGAGDWHECRKDEPNVCRQWSQEKPK